MESAQKSKKKVADSDQHFLKQIIEQPPNDVQFDGLKPDFSYQIDHVYGFGGVHYQNGIHFGKTNDEIIFAAAAVGVCQDLKTNQQKFFGGIEKPKNAEKYLPNNPVHQDDINTIDIAGGEARHIVATGEVGKSGTIHVWDTNTMASIAQFDLGGKSMGVGALSISPCQRYVAVVDRCNDHNMTIYNIQRKKVLMVMSAGTDAISNIQWSKKQNDLRFAAVTTRAVQFWNPADASKKLFKNGIFGQKFQQTKFQCATFDEDGVCYTGGANGGIHIWDQKGDLGLVLKCHAGEVTSISAQNGTLVSTGKDDMISVFSMKDGEYSFQRHIPLGQYHCASSIDVLDGKIVVGHDNGRIQTVDVSGENLQSVNANHFEGESWGLYTTRKGTFLTCGDDNNIFEFDIKQKKLVKEGKVWTQELNDGKAYETDKGRSTASTLSKLPSHQQARALTYSEKLGHVVISNNNGDITIVQYDDFSKKVTSFSTPKEWCEVLRYSPCDKFLAIGSHDNNIYIYKVSDSGEYTPHWTIKMMFSSAVTCLDWSKDSRHIRAIDQAYSKLYFDLENQEHVKEGQTTLTAANMWVTSTCKLGWEVMGVYHQGSDGSDINAVDTNGDRTLVASGDDRGSVCIYKWPILNNSADCWRLTGHAEHVPKIRFWNSETNPEDKYLISAGGNDKTYIQWKQVPAQGEEQKE